MPDGATVTINYTCGGCGTAYYDEVILSPDPVVLGRTRA